MFGLTLSIMSGYYTPLSAMTSGYETLRVSFSSLRHCVTLGTGFPGRDSPVSARESVVRVSLRRCHQYSSYCALRHCYLLKFESCWDAAWCDRTSNLWRAFTRLSLWMAAERGEGWTFGAGVFRGWRFSKNNYTKCYIWPHCCLYSNN